MVKSNKYKPAFKRRCKAMIEAEIENPESQKGINFCVNQCPYDECIAVIPRLSSVEARGESAPHLRKRKAVELYSQGYSKRKIAKALGVTFRTVNTYLEE